MEKTEERRHLVFVPFNPVGHLVAAVELAKLILSFSTTHHFTITILVMTNSVPNPEVSSFLSSTSLPNLSFLHLPPVSLPVLPDNIRPQAFAAVVLDLFKPLVRSAIQTLHSSSPVTALLLDFFCSNMIDLGHELGIPPYVFFTSSVSFLGFLLLYPTSIDPLIPDDGKAVEMVGETIPFPGFSSKFPLPSFPDVFSFGKDDAYRAFLEHGRRLRKVQGFIVNSFDALQRAPVRAFEEGLYLPEQPSPSMYNIGPLLSLRSERTHECFTWLDKQPERSVVFLCFGSRGSFPEAQVREMAVGLERSGHRFLWVLRAPPEKGVRGNMRDAVLEDVLPDGFLERTRERGLVWPSFAPQGEILGHAAVGGFVTHCGWNSCLESLWFGVPMAAWPLYAEQQVNAFEMVEEMGVAVKVRTDRVAGNRATAEEVERAVRALMGKESGAVREKVTEMRGEARKAVEEGGSSHRSMVRLLEQWYRGAARGSSAISAVTA